MPHKQSRIVVSKTLRCCRSDRKQQRHDANDDAHVLNLMMICCEERSPYGPAVDTANMFLELLCAAYKRYQQQGSIIIAGNNNELAEMMGESSSSSSIIQQQSKDFTIRITIYHAQSMDYPQTNQEWDGYHGIIIPGSLSAAYDTHVEWIHRLMTVIQHEIHEKQRKTLGVCFGHQCFAHSFGLLRTSIQNDDRTSTGNGSCHQKEFTAQHECGLASKCSIGPVAGRKSFQLKVEGKFLLGHTTTSYHPDKNSHENNKQTTQPSPRECLEMLYTRGDMVQSLPLAGITLFGSGELPNEACAYFASEKDVLQFQNHVEQQQSNSFSSGETVTSWKQTLDNIVVLPYAITFQAHPEFMTPLGCKVNYVNTVKAMEESGAISQETSKVACEDANLHYNALSCDSLDATISAGVILGWFKE